MDGGVVVIRQPLVTGLAMVHNPLLESLTGESVDNVAEILPWHLLALFPNRQRVDDLLEGHTVVPDELESEPFILRHCYVPHIIAVNGLLQRV